MSLSADLTTLLGNDTATWITGAFAGASTLAAAFMGWRMHRAALRHTEWLARRQQDIDDAVRAAQKEHAEALAAQARRHAEELREREAVHQRHLRAIGFIEDSATKIIAALEVFTGIVRAAPTLPNHDLLQRARVATEQLSLIDQTARALSSRIKIRHYSELCDYVDLLTLVLLDLTRDSSQRLAEYGTRMTRYREFLERIQRRIPWLVESFRDPTFAATRPAEAGLRREIRKELDRHGMRRTGVVGRIQLRQSGYGEHHSERSLLEGEDG